MLRNNLPKNLASAYLALFITNSIWAIAGPIIKITLEYIPLNTFLLFRFIIVCLIMLPFVILELRKNPIDKRDYFNFFMLGLFSQGSLFLIFAAYEYTSVLEATIIAVLGNMTSVAAGHYFYKEKIDKNVRTGLIIATIGTILIVLEPLLNTSLTSPVISSSIRSRVWGNFLAVLYNLVFMIYIIWSKMSMGERSTLLKKTLSFVHIKPMHKKYTPFTLSGVSFYVGLMVYVPLGLMENFGLFGANTLAPDSFTLIPILGVVYMAVLSSIIAYLCFQWALEHVAVRDSALFSYLQPVIAVPFAYLLLREVPTIATIINSSVIALGVIVAELKKS